MKIEKINIDKLIPYEKNAKIHTPEQIEQIKNSIKEFGNNDPIAIDENNMIIEGHGRITALKELGYKEVEAVRLSHLSEEQKKAYILAHNKLTMNTDFDLALLSDELDFLKDTDIDMSDFGFDLEEDLLEEDEDVLDKDEILKYTIVFNDEEEQETFLKFIDFLNNKYSDVDSISSRLYSYINEYV